MRSNNASNQINCNKYTQSIGLVNQDSPMRPNICRSAKLKPEIIPSEFTRVITRKQVEEIKKSLISDQQTLKQYSQKLLKKKQKGKTSRTPIAKSKLLFDASVTQPNIRKRKSVSPSSFIHASINKKRAKGSRKSPIISKLNELNSTINLYAQTAKGALQRRIKQRNQSPPQKQVINKKEESITLNQHFNELDKILDMQELSFSFCRRIEPRNRQVCNYLSKLRKMNFDFTGSCELFSKIVDSLHQISLNSREKQSNLPKCEVHSGIALLIKPLDIAHISMKELLGFQISSAQLQFNPQLIQKSDYSKKQSNNPIYYKSKHKIQDHQDQIYKTEQRIKKIIQIDKFCQQYKIREEMIREYLKLKKQIKIEQLQNKKFKSYAQSIGKHNSKEYFTRTYNCSLDLANDSDLQSKLRRKSPQFSASFKTEQSRNNQKYEKSKQQIAQIDKQRNRNRANWSKAKNKTSPAKRILKY